MTILKHVQHNAATAIQSGVRGYKARKEVEQKKKVKCAAITIQACIRGFKARREVKQIRKTKAEREEAVVKIQSGYRGMKAREDFHEKKRQFNEKLKKEKEEAAAAVKIQSGYRGMKARAEVMEKKKEKAKNAGKMQVDTDETLKDVSSISLTKNGGAQGSKQVDDTEADTDLPLDENEAATKIQSGFRGHQARKKVNLMKEQEDREEHSSSEGEQEKTPPKIKKKTSKSAENSTSARNPDEGDDEESEAEEVDIDLNDPEVGQAALKIQSSFRGHQARKEVQEMKECNLKANVKVEEEIDIDLNDPEVGNAALKIQSSFRGHQARKEVQEMKENANAEDKKIEEEEEIDIDLDDPEVGNAALKIQSSFRGHQARKEVQAMKECPKENDAVPKPAEVEEIDIDLDDPEVGNAALKIQSSFRGHQARKEVEAMKEGKGGTNTAEEDNEEINDDGGVTEESETDDDSKTHAIKPKKAPFSLMQDFTRQEKEEKEIEHEIHQYIRAGRAGDAEKQEAIVKIQSGYRGMKAREEVKVIRKERREKEEAVVKIQSGYRGMKAREEVKQRRMAVSSMQEIQEEEEEEEGSSEESKSKTDDEAVDIDLDDPEVGNAALKIQSSFRGHQARKEVQARKDNQEQNLKGSSEENGGESKDGKNSEDEEAIDIDLEDPEVGKAAVKIQSSFRGHQARKEVEALKENQENHQDDKQVEKGEDVDIDLEDPEVGKAALKIQSSFRGHQARKEVETMKENKEQHAEEKVNIDEEIDIDLNDPEVGNAALKIQSSFRGHQARKEVEALKEQKEDVDREKTVKNAEEEEIDIDLEDPEVGKAALKIQSSFRGHQARKEVDAIKENKDKTSEEKPADEQKLSNEIEDIDIDLDDPEVGNAALKIQSSFRGHQARKEVEAMKESKTDDMDKHSVKDEGKEEADEIDIDLEDPEVGKAALKIQSSFRGHQARKEVESIKENKALEEGLDKKADSDENDAKQEGNEEIDIDLEDPEVGKAALKIQSSFRGHQARKEVDNIKENKGREEKPDKNTESDETNAKNEEEVEIDIDLEDPEVGKAALKIQSSFRGHQARKEVETIRESKDKPVEEPPEREEEIDIDLEDPEVGKAALKIQSSFRGHQARKEVETIKEIKANPAKETPADEEEEIDIDLEDPEVGKAALKIQSSFRGHQARKEVETMKDNKEAPTKVKGEEEEPANEEEEIDIDLDDPEVGNAALKIQSSFRGHQARKEVQSLKENKESEKKTSAEEEIDIDLNDPEVGNAALKIQSSFRGHQARKEVKSMKDKEEEADEKKEENQDEEIDIDLNDPEVGNAALKIQSSFRGHQARKEVEAMKDDNRDNVKNSEPHKDMDQMENEKNAANKEYERQKAEAAVKIQAGFRGHQGRKELEMAIEKEQKHLSELTAAEDIDSGTSMSSKSSVANPKEPIPVKGEIIKVESADSGSEMVLEVVENDDDDDQKTSNEEDVNDDGGLTEESVTEDSSRTHAIKPKRAPFSLIKMFVNMMTPNLRKHKVGVKGEESKMSKSNSMHNVSSSAESSTSEGSKSSRKKLSKRLSRSRNSVASESVSSSSVSTKPNPIVAAES